MDVGFKVYDGCSTWVLCKDFGVPKGGGVCNMYVFIYFYLFFGVGVLVPSLTSLLTASLLSMLKCAQMFWSVKGGGEMSVVLEHG